MWKEIRADRTEAGVLTAHGRPTATRGRDLGEKRNALSLGTAIRYATAAGMATQRAHRAFLAHRKAKAAGLILPAAAAEPAECTNDLPAAASPSRRTQNCTNEFPSARRRPDIDPLAALRARIRRLLDGAGPHDADQRDLAAAMLAVRLPGAAPYRGPIDLAVLDQALAPVRFDAAALAWLATLAPAAGPGRADDRQQALAA